MSMTTLMTRWTICACASCGHPVIGAHDCEKQDVPVSRFARVVFLNERGDVIATLASLRLRKE